MNFSDLQLRSFHQAVHAGFHDKPRELGTELMLIVSEVAEAMEELRNNRATNEVYFSDYNGQQKPEGFPIELADAVIRIMDTAGSLGIDLEGAILQKLEFNKTRAYRHGNRAF